MTVQLDQGRGDEFAKIFEERFLRVVADTAAISADASQSGYS